jgi:KaiC/GvpD/RAD55 family RecA-like ATPase
VTSPGRVSTGIDRLDAMLGGGLVAGTLTVIYGATG